jgi:hypothetical protein
VVSLARARCRARLDLVDHLRASARVLDGRVQAALETAAMRDDFERRPVDSRTSSSRDRLRTNRAGQMAAGRLAHLRRTANRRGFVRRLLLTRSAAARATHGHRRDEHDAGDA